MKKLFLILLLFISCNVESKTYKITIYYTNGDKEKLYFEGNYRFYLYNGCLMNDVNTVVCGVRKFKIND